VSVHAGEFSTTLPLFAIAFLLGFYCWQGGVKYLIWIPIFIAFGILGGKRALPFYIPILFLFVYVLFIYYGRRSGPILTPIVNKRRLKKLIFRFALIGFATLYIGAVTQEALNPEQTVGGSFDPAFMVKTVIEYETNVMEEGGYFEKGQAQPHKGPPLATGRLSSTFFTFVRLVNEGPFTLLFGSGPGLLTATSIKGETIIDTLLTIGIRYGVTGFVWVMNQIGLLGVLFWLILCAQLFRKGLIVYRTIPEVYWKAIALGFLGASFVFLLDFFTYSLSTLTMGVLTPVYFYAAAICCRQLYHEGARLKVATVTVR
jgi:hypothetical protein